MPRALAILLAIVMSLVSASPALAEGGAPAPDPAGSAERRWYGLPLVIADATAFALVVGGFGLATSTNNSGIGKAMLGAGGAIYLLDGMVVHDQNGQSEKALVSVPIRLATAGGMAFVGALAGFALGQGCQKPAGPSPDNYCGFSYVGWGLGVGLAAGMVTGSVIDNKRAYKPLPESRSPTVSLAPLVDPVRAVAGVGVRGTW
jgi:hypothetical protein